MSTVINPPQKIEKSNSLSVFIAGSIKQGSSQDWQSDLIKKLSDCDLTFYNPRGDHCDTSLEQSINNTVFREQVEWELQAIDEADIIVFYFVPGAKSEISLLNLGRCSEKYAYADVIVCCPNGYWRKGNVDIVCKKAHFRQVENISKLADAVRELHDRHIKDIEESRNFSCTVPPPMPRQYSLVRFIEPNTALHDQYPFKKDKILVFLGEIPNMPGHGIVAEYDSGKMFFGYHTDNFVEIPEEEC